MSTRLAKGGRLIDRSKALEFSFNGKRLRGFEGDTLASALLANGVPDAAALVVKAGLIILAVWLQRQERV